MSVRLLVVKLIEAGLTLEIWEGSLAAYKGGGSESNPRINSDGVSKG